MPSVKYLGHSTFLVETADHSILIDPFLDGNPSAQIAAADVSPDVILITHGHEDHIADTVSIASRANSLVIANFEIIGWLQKQGLTNVHPQHVGGSRKHSFGEVKLTRAEHGSALPDGSYGGVACGFVLTLEGKRIYFTGDTGLFSDMSLIGRGGLDLAVLPIGDNFTMGPDDALVAVDLIQAKEVIPSHYNTWPVIEQDPNEWAQRVNDETNSRCVVLGVGESHQLR